MFETIIYIVFLLNVKYYLILDFFYLALCRCISIIAISKMYNISIEKKEKRIEF